MIIPIQNWILIKLAKQSERSQESRHDAVFEEPTLDSLPTSARVRAAPDLESYVPRTSLTHFFGPNRLPTGKITMFHGPSGVGKSREAYELISRIDRCEPSHIYFRRRTLEVPLEAQNLQTRRVILFIDDMLAAVSPSEPDSQEDDKSAGTIDQLEEIVAFFNERGANLDVIITIQNDQLTAIKKELLDRFPDLVMVPVPAPSTEEKRQYILSRAENLGIHPLAEMQIQRLISVSDNFGALFDFFRLLAVERKSTVDDDAIEQFAALKHDNWTRSLSQIDRRILAVLTSLDEWNIPPDIDLVTLLTLLAENKRPYMWNRLRAKQDVNRLADRWLAKDGDLVYCHESRFLKNTGIAPDLPAAGLFLCGNLKLLSANHRFDIVKTTARALHHAGMYSESISLNSSLLRLSDRAFGGNPKVRRSETVFHRGHSQFYLGRLSWPDAEASYESAISLDPQNVHAIHALAVLKFRSGKKDAAAQLLEGVCANNPNDSVAFSTFLEWHSKHGVGAHRSGVSAYRALLRLLRNPELGARERMSASISCALFSVHVADCLFRAGEVVKATRRRDRASKQVESTLTLLESYSQKVPRVSIASLAQMLGSLSVQRSQWERAEHFLQQAVSLNPNNWLAWWNLGSVFEAKGEFRRAIEFFLKSAEGQQMPVLFGQLRSIISSWLVSRVALSKLPPNIQMEHLRFNKGKGELVYRGILTPSEIAVLVAQSQEKDFLAAIRGLLNQSRMLTEKLALSGLDLSELEDIRFNCAKRAYELDPEGAAGIKNISDYAYEYFKRAKRRENKEELKQAYLLLLDVQERYLERMDLRAANFPMWQMGECLEAELGTITSRALKLFIESASLEDSQTAAGRLNDKVRKTGDYEAAVKLGLELVREKPNSAHVYKGVLLCCRFVWYSYLRKLSPELVELLHDRLVAVGTSIAFRTLGVILQRNAENERALPFLERYRDDQDVRALRALWECYSKLGRHIEADSVLNTLRAVSAGGHLQSLESRAQRYAHQATMESVPSTTDAG
jgi:tetratricopeptide (TPR) repeat protein